MIRAAGLPEPSANVLVAGESVDFWWPEQRVIVELDSWKFHNTRKEFENDRRTDIKLQLASCRVLRLTQRRIEFEPTQLVADLSAILSDAPPSAAADL